MRRGMRNLRINETAFEYFPPDDYMTDLNEDGEHTGEFRERYRDPVPYRGNIGVPSGYAANEMFGTDTRYTHILVMDDQEAEIEETGVIRWKGDLYEIRAVRPSINSLSVALRKKTKNHAERECT